MSKPEPFCNGHQLTLPEKLRKVRAPKRHCGKIFIPTLQRKDPAPGGAAARSHFWLAQQTCAVFVSFCFTITNREKQFVLVPGFYLLPGVWVMVRLNPTAWSL